MTREGNLPAQPIVEAVFEVCDQKWRGIGSIPQSGLRIRPEFSAYDAEKIFGMAEYQGRRTHRMHQRAGSSRGLKSRRIARHSEQVYP